MDATTNKVKRTTTLQLMKSTGNTHVYHEEGHDRNKQIFPTIYVQKAALGSQSAPPPDKITVTVEWDPV